MSRGSAETQESLRASDVLKHLGIRGALVGLLLGAFALINWVMGR